MTANALAGHLSLPIGRLRLLEFLFHQEHTVTESVEHIGLAQSQVSTHLDPWPTAVTSRSAAKAATPYYHVADPRVAQQVMLAHAFAADNHTALCACHRIGKPNAGNT